jgi:lysine 6-dehydrogenase
VLANGLPVWRDPLGDMERLEFPKPFRVLEAFSTSGGSSTLPESFRGRVKRLDYKTIRYPDHCQQMRLLRDLGFMSLEPQLIAGKRVVPRQLLVQRLEAALPRETDDVVLLRVYVRGRRFGHGAKIRYQMVDHADSKSGLTAMMRTTGFSVAIVALMLGRGQVECAGAFTGENCVPSADYIRELRKRGLGLTMHTTYEPPLNKPKRSRAAGRGRPAARRV